jgi:predicted nucleic acid-binding protein
LVRFWDTSAIAPLLVQEPRTARVRELLEWDAELAVWWATPVECWSLLARRAREGGFPAGSEDEAANRLDLLRAAWYEVLPSEAVRMRARRLLRLHPLRAADALQLAAAQVWAADDEAAEFVAADARLCDAARLEGLVVIRL